MVEFLSACVMVLMIVGAISISSAAIAAVMCIGCDIVDWQRSYELDAFLKQFIGWNMLIFPVAFGLAGILFLIGVLIA